jgi:hypothetical protein
MNSIDAAAEVDQLIKKKHLPDNKERSFRTRHQDDRLVCLGVPVPDPKGMVSVFRSLYRLLLCDHTRTGLPEGVEDRRSQAEGEYREIKAMLILRFGFRDEWRKYAAKIARVQSAPTH